MKYYDLSPRKKLTGKSAKVNQKKLGSDGRSYESDIEYVLKSGSRSAVASSYYYQSEDYDGVYEAMGQEPPSKSSSSLKLDKGIFAFQVNGDKCGEQLSPGTHPFYSYITYLSSQKYENVNNEEFTEKLWMLAWYRVHKLDTKYTTCGAKELYVLDDLMRALMEELLGADCDNEAHFLFIVPYGFETKMREKYGWSDEYLDGIYNKAYDTLFPKETYVIKKGTKVIGKDTIPEDVKSKIRAIEIPDGVTELAEGAFDGCAELEEIVLPEGITKIGEMAFAYCTALKRVVIPKGVKEIPRWAFGRSNKLEEVVLPEGLKTIGESAFYCCYGLKKVNIPSTVTDMGSAFSSSGIEELTVPSISSIDSYAFSNCTKLKNIILAEGPKSIGNGAFRNCTSLEKIVIPDSVESIGWNAFEDCESLKEIHLPKGTLDYGNHAIFNSCPSVETVYLPNTVKRISVGVFGTAPSKVYFDGTVAEWEDKVKDSKYNLFFPKATVYCKDGSFKLP